MEASEIDTVSKGSVLDWSLTESLLADDSDIDTVSFSQQSCSPDKLFASITDHEPLFTPQHTPDLLSSRSLENGEVGGGNISVDSLDTSSHYGTCHLVEKCISREGHRNNYRLACIQASLSGSSHNDLNPTTFNGVDSSDCHSRKSEGNESSETLVSGSSNILKNQSPKANFYFSSSNTERVSNSHSQKTETPLTKSSQRFASTNPFVPLYGLQSSHSSVGSDLTSPPQSLVRLFMNQNASPTPPPNPTRRLNPETRQQALLSNERNNNSSDAKMGREFHLGPTNNCDNGDSNHFPPYDGDQRLIRGTAPIREEEGDLSEYQEFVDWQHKNTLMNRRPKIAWGVPEADPSSNQHLKTRRETSQLSSGYHSSKHSDERLFVRRVNSGPSQNSQEPPPPPPRTCSTQLSQQQDLQTSNNTQTGMRGNENALPGLNNRAQNDFPPQVEGRLRDQSVSNGSARDGELQPEGHALYVCYPKYSLPDLSFLTGQEKKVIMSPTEPVLRRTHSARGGDQTAKSRRSRPKSLSDFENLAKNAVGNFNHISDWDSLEVLLDNTQFKDILAKIRSQQTAPAPTLREPGRQTLNGSLSASSLLTTGVKMRRKKQLIRNKSDVDRHQVAGSQQPGQYPSQHQKNKRFSLQEPLRDIYEEDAQPSSSWACHMPRSVTMPSCYQHAMPFGPYHPMPPIHYPPYGYQPGFSAYYPHPPPPPPPPPHFQYYGGMNYTGCLSPPSSYAIPPLHCAQEHACPSVDHLSEMLAANMSIHKMINVIAQTDPRLSRNSSSRSTPVTPSRSQQLFEPILEHIETTVEQPQNAPLTRAKSAPKAEETNQRTRNGNNCKFTAAKEPRKRTNSKSSASRGAGSDRAFKDHEPTTNEPKGYSRKIVPTNNTRRPTSLQTKSVGKSMIPVPKSLRSPVGNPTRK